MEKILKFCPSYGTQRTNCKLTCILAAFRNAAECGEVVAGTISLSSTAMVKWG
jgi:hypothetical protein